MKERRGMEGGEEEGRRRGEYLFSMDAPRQVTFITTSFDQSKILYHAKKERVKRGERVGGVRGVRGERGDRGDESERRQREREG